MALRQGQDLSTVSRLRLGLEGPLSEKSHPQRGLHRPLETLQRLLCPPVPVTVAREGMGVGVSSVVQSVSYSVNKLPHSSVPSAGAKLGAVAQSKGVVFSLKESQPHRTVCS